MHAVTAGASGPNLVLLPDPATGAAVFRNLIGPLAQKACVHAVDWLGAGLSGRPDIKFASRDEAESWYVESLEIWRARNGIEDMVLVAHAFGGYLAALYAMRYPARVHHLILVSPLGVGKRPRKRSKVPRPPAPPATTFAPFVPQALARWGVTPGLLRQALGRRCCTALAAFAAQRFGVAQRTVMVHEAYWFPVLTDCTGAQAATRLMFSPEGWPLEPLYLNLPQLLKHDLTFIYGESERGSASAQAAESVCKRRVQMSELLSLPSFMTRLPSSIDSEMQPKPAKKQAAHGAHSSHVHYVPEAAANAFVEQPQRFVEELLNTLERQLQPSTNGKDVGMQGLQGLSPPTDAHPREQDTRADLKVETENKHSVLDTLLIFALNAAR